MNAKLKILCTGKATIVELDGKTIGQGIEAINLHHNGAGEAIVTLSINVEDFSFMPDGYFSEVEEKIAKAEPPEEQILGRTE